MTHGEQFALHVEMDVAIMSARHRGCMKPILFFWRRDDGLLGCRAQDPSIPMASLMGASKGETVREAIESCHRDVMCRKLEKRERLM